MCVTRKKARYKADMGRYFGAAARVRDAMGRWTAVADHIFGKWSSARCPPSLWKRSGH